VNKKSEKILVDCHLDIAYSIRANRRNFEDINPKFMISYDQLRKSGADIFFSTIFVSHRRASAYKEEAIQQIKFYKKILKDYDSFYQILTNNNLKNTRNLNFKFEQNINGKIENGYCTIEYPKKIFCEYLKNNNKILVSNGKSLVIKTLTSYYRYPLDKTPLNLILDKNFLIDKINILEERIIDGSFINYKIKENDSEISVFFDKETFNLVGWQNTDIYQNFNITFLSSIRKNRIISREMFQLPIQN